ncbi:MAPEG family protein [Methylobacterium sp. J-076]|uniref:MAPEG family protein n=1 Tax=Methylobacterium sp. J-076 TaxID=2836655 RepID=UPI001FBAF928|nr:MAPEG family protein [Methylobacterium sp. J-076]MCJ2012400.1 MAPEG family protein [Methylobacterium sp. J-076]
MLSTEMIVLGLSVVLLVVHIALQGATVTRERGTDWNMGARDGAGAPLGVLAGRASRALDNYKETWPALIAMALALAVTGRTGGVGAVGALVWLAARLVYIPLYLAGIPVWRTLVYVVSMAGLAMMVVRLFTGA